MNRKGFLNELEKALEHKMSDTEIKEQLQFYSNYIKTEVSVGRNEMEVIEELGDPWGLAKNLGYGHQETYVDEETIQEKVHSTNEQGPKIYTTNSKWVLWGIFLLVLFVLFAVLSFVSAIFKIFAPILLPLLFISFLFRIFRNR